jgi:hypothetical protein
MNSVNISNNVVINIDQQTSTLVKNIAREWSPLSAILIIEGKKKYFSYLPIGQIGGSEKGNKQYFNLSLIYMYFL